jgi:hypothetical protein
MYHSNIGVQIIGVLDLGTANLGLSVPKKQRAERFWVPSAAALYTECHINPKHEWDLVFDVIGGGKETSSRV